MNQQEIAQAIRNNVKTLTELWVNLVREDPRNISGEGLSTHEIIDHVPAIIEEICDLLKADKLANLKNTHEARVSVYTRFHQGYRGSDLVRELSFLRHILFDHLALIWSNNTSGITIETYTKVAQIINSYLDEELRFAISVYSEMSPPNRQDSKTT